MNKILFICEGNVARSQIAEAFFNHLSHSHAGQSAGLLDFTPAKYVHPMREVVQVMEEEGINVANNLVKTVTQAMIEESDRLIVLCEKSRCPDFIRNSPKAEFFTLPDPFGKELADFRLIRNQIKKIIHALVELNPVLQ